ncbi:tRNA-dependent cyclodipeptide synthase [Kutzneria chonburiensis]|uniref:Cyclodipeptide synthase n=1 Tax=Kutzneria chonburiensis TaxID=1483604 RepID=A0ABV6MQF8_9PSEU
MRDTGAHACIGVSPFNGYYTAERIAALAAWARRTFSDFHFFVPNEPAAYTLEALGYEPARARHKARRQGNLVLNRIGRALADIGVRDAGRRVLDSARLQDNAAYHRIHDDVIRLFQSDNVFRDQTMASSEWVLAKRLPAGQEPTERQRLLAVRYFLAELPLFLDTPGIVGVSSSVFVYHQRVSFLERLYLGSLARRPVPAQGFLVLSAEAVVPV